MKTQWPQKAASEPLSGGRILGWPLEVLAWLWRRLCGFSHRSVSWGGVERWEVVFGTGTSQALVLGRNKAETFLA